MSNKDFCESAIRRLNTVHEKWVLEVQEYNVKESDFPRKVSVHLVKNGQTLFFTVVNKVRGFNEDSIYIPVIHFILDLFLNKKIMLL